MISDNHPSECSTEPNEGIMPNEAIYQGRYVLNSICNKNVYILYIQELVYFKLVQSFWNSYTSYLPNHSNDIIKCSTAFGIYVNYAPRTQFSYCY